MQPWVCPGCGRPATAFGRPAGFAVRQQPVGIDGGTFAGQERGGQGGAQECGGTGVVRMEVGFQHQDDAPAHFARDAQVQGSVARHRVDEQGLPPIGQASR